MEQKTQGYLYLIGFAACIPMANWLIENVGIYCEASGPCMIPVAPGILAPSGVLMVGLALVLRDLVQRTLGVRWALAAIVFGALLSGFVASPALVFASIAAFVISETMDLAVYTPLQKKGLVLAVLASSIVGLVADSAVFLKFAVKLLLKKQYIIKNIDSTIILQKPIISPYITDIKNNISTIVQCDDISIKATTTDFLGFIGKSKGICAISTVLISKEN